MKCIVFAGKIAEKNKTHKLADVNNIVQDTLEDMENNGKDLWKFPLRHEVFKVLTCKLQTCSIQALRQFELLRSKIG